MKLIGMLLACALMACAAGETILIRDADVYPVTGKEMKGMSVLIQDGKIAEIAAKILPPKGARIVEAKGMRVYPGMIDSGTELGLSEVSAVRESVDTGELGEFMPQLKALVAVNPDSEHFGVVRVNGITSAMTFPSSGGGGGGRGGGGGQLISGQAALIHTDGWTWEDMEIKRSAAMSVAFPSMGGRGGRGGAIPDSVVEILGQTGIAGSAAASRRAYEESLAKLNDFFDNARRYQKAKAAHLSDFRTDLKFEAMLPVLEGKVPVAVSAARASTIHDAVQWAKKQNIKLVILQPREIGKAAADLKAENVPVVFGRVLALPETEDSAYDEAFTLPAEAYKAGVKFAFGTFTNEFVRNIPYQAATAVAFGLPYEEALKAVTINPAQIWGSSDQVGSVEKGKIADLIVTDGDPLEIQTQVKHLYIKGKEVSLENKQTRLYQRYLNRN
ncbi:MAG TPA: amidohydrolase family protein [Candidatus Sulfopaludibacter sp.]|jgi:imidazolonepropionase-like amidohydrolase|nr:amidohydrolase family protein [Candidatus Sulfopaludibacter sp.]